MSKFFLQNLQTLQRRASGRWILLARGRTAAESGLYVAQRDAAFLTLRHESFGQLWPVSQDCYSKRTVRCFVPVPENRVQPRLMVLRLMLQFIKRGSDDRDAELEDVS